MRVTLPIDESLPALIAHLQKTRSLVVAAPPGSGKTTRIPPALLKSGLLSRDHPAMVLLQPRRIAARAAASRIADENEWTLGDEVGYHVRFDKVLTHRTRIRVLTEGILTRQLVDDPFLPGIGAVILDEFHERSIHVDLAIALLREIQQTVREDLMLLVTSATLDAEPIAKFLGNCPILKAPGQSFPVAMENVLQSQSISTRDLPGQIYNAVEEILKAPRDSGHVLVFLPGADEIRRTERELIPLMQQYNLLVLPLHGQLSPEAQALALRPARQTKVILATNVAETSLTIEGVKTVIDSGLARVAFYDPQRGLDRLELVRISQASAIQRAGRAGRTAPGHCLRLWSLKDSNLMEAFERPEIQRIDLASTLLAVHSWSDRGPVWFPWFEAPSGATIEAAETLLEGLGALNADRKITLIGRAMLNVPAHPRLARLLIGAVDLNVADAGADLAAILSERDFVLDKTTGRAPNLLGDSDLLYRLDLLHQARLQHFDERLGHLIEPQMARQVDKTATQFRMIASRLSKSKGIGGKDVDSEVFLKLALLAYPDRVCRRRAGDKEAGLMVGGIGVRLSAVSQVRQAEFFLALDAREDSRARTREAAVQMASMIEPGWLGELFPEAIRKTQTAYFDEARQRVVGQAQTTYRDLVIESHDAPAGAELAGKVLAAALAGRARGIYLSKPGSAQWVARVDLLRRAMPERGWPVLDDGVLARTLGEACRNKRGVEDLTDEVLMGSMEGLLEYPLSHQLNVLAPTHFVLPTGNRVLIEYRENQAPVLAARLQEMFGMRETPRVAEGRVALLLHLLAPNYRPVQVTEDLPSFWAGTYFQVRKDLRARYPKHSWPDDPLTALPVAKGRRR